MPNIYADSTDGYIRYFGIGTAWTVVRDGSSGAVTASDAGEVFEYSVNFLNGTPVATDGDVVIDGFDAKTDKLIIRISQSILISANNFNILKKELINYFKQKDSISVSEFKDLFIMTSSDSDQLLSYYLEQKLFLQFLLQLES